MPYGIGDERYGLEPIPFHTKKYKYIKKKKKDKKKRKRNEENNKENEIPGHNYSVYKYWFDC